MKKADLRQGVALVKEYNKRLSEGYTTFEEFDKFYSFIDKREERPFQRGLIVSALFDGSNMGLSEETIIEILEVAGLCEEDE